MPAHDTLVFIPAWNEEDNLPAVLDELGAVLPDVDVLVVDDGSTDATARPWRESTARGCSRSTRTAGCRRASRPATSRRASTATRSAAASTPTGSTRPPS